jgi:hypothetical protein
MNAAWPNSCSTKVNKANLYEVFGRGREQFKLNALAMRRKMHYDNQIKLQTQMS